MCAPAPRTWKLRRYKLTPFLCLCTFVHIWACLYMRFIQIQKWDQTILYLFGVKKYALIKRLQCNGKPKFDKYYIIISDLVNLNITVSSKDIVEEIFFWLFWEIWHNLRPRQSLCSVTWANLWLGASNKYFKISMVINDTWSFKFIDIQESIPLKRNLYLHYLQKVFTP